MTRFHYGDAKNSDMRYLLGHALPDAIFALERNGKKHVWLSALEIDAFKEKNINDSLCIHNESELTQDIGSTKDLRATQICALIKTYVAPDEEVLVSRNLPIDIYKIIEQHHDSVRVVETLFPERLTKATTEILQITTSQQAAKAAIVMIESILKESVIDKDTLMFENEVLTSESLKQRVELTLFEMGFICSEGLIISCGADAAMPHHPGAGPLRPHQTIVCDIFPQQHMHGYFGDMTRTFVKGTPSAEIERMYTAVAAAHQSALSEVKAGASTRDLYQLSADIIKGHGFDVGRSMTNEGYIHSLGHGVGLEIHEAPLLHSRSNTTLEERMVITIEPGLYYKAHGGVRIEDTVVVTNEGYEFLAAHHYNWVIQ